MLKNHLESVIQKLRKKWTKNKQKQQQEQQQQNLGGNVVRVDRIQGKKVKKKTASY